MLYIVCIYEYMCAHIYKNVNIYERIHNKLGLCLTGWERRNNWGKQNKQKANLNLHVRIQFYLKNFKGEKITCEFASRSWIFISS